MKRLLLILLVFISCTVDDRIKEIEDLQEQIEKLISSLEGVDVDSESVTAQLEILQNQLSELQSEIEAETETETEEDRDESTFTGLYDGYSWIQERDNAGVNLDETEKQLIYINDDTVYFGNLYDAENIYDECEKEITELVSGEELNEDGDVAEIFFEVNTPEQLMIIAYYPEYEESIRIIFEVNDSVLNMNTSYSSGNGEFLDSEDDVYNETTSFTWEDFEDFECP